MEPPGPHLRGGSKAAGDVHLSAQPLRLAAAAASVALALTSSGEVVLLIVLLVVAASDAIAAAAAVLALTAVAVRWGSTSLDAIAGAQAVLGPGGAVGSAFEVVVSWSAGAALVLASPGGWPAVAFGAAAALVVAGPSAGGAGDVALRVGAAALAMAVTVAAGRRVPPGAARPAAAALAAAALALALAG